MQKHLNKIKVDCLFDPIKFSIILTRREAWLEVKGHPWPYALGCVSQYIEFIVNNYCQFRFVIAANYFDDVVVDVISLDICG